jgi:hypothetical protein
MAEWITLILRFSGSAHFKASGYTRKYANSCYLCAKSLETTTDSLTFDNDDVKYHPASLAFNVFQRSESLHTAAENSGSIDIGLHRYIENRQENKILRFLCFISLLYSPAGGGDGMFKVWQRGDGPDPLHR